MDDPDTIPSRLHDLETRPPIQAESPSLLGRLLVIALIALVIFAGWFILGR